MASEPAGPIFVKFAHRMHTDKSEPLLSSSERKPPAPVRIGHQIIRWISCRKWSVSFLIGTWMTILYSARIDVTGFSWQSWWTLGLTGTALFFLINNQPPDLVLLSVTVLLRLSGVVTDEQAFSGFHSDGILAIGALFAVAKSLETSGAIEWCMAFFLFRTNSIGAPFFHFASIVTSMFKVRYSVDL
jgi:di/tricarboxylate transporter